MRVTAEGSRSRPRLQIALIALTLASCGGPRTYEQAYLRAADNWVFRRDFARADRLFNAFDYGHAILSETLLRDPTGGAVRLEGPVYAFITGRLLQAPPNVPLDAHAIAPTYGAGFPEAIATFEWAHQLHRQLYDIIADQRYSVGERDRRIAAALRYYRSRRDLALSSTPKSMVLMEGQPYSLAFRRATPRFNRLIWSYHWLQMGLYDAMLGADAPAARARAVDATVDRFFVLAEHSGDEFSEMPMSASIAPRFSAAWPEAAIIFDNLHSLHDVVSDILASPLVSRERKHDEVSRALDHYRDSTTLVTTRDEWRAMSRAMGVAHMGGAIPSTPETIP